MPLLATHSSLPFDFWDLLVSLAEAMTNTLWYLTAFLASSSVVVPNGALQAVSAQYLLGLGESVIVVRQSTRRN